MRHAIRNDDILEELAYFRNGAGQIVFADKFGNTHPPSYLGKWTEAYKNSLGIYEIIAGSCDTFEFKSVGSSFSLSGGKAVETIITEAIPLATIQQRELDKVYEEYEAAMVPVKNGWTDSERETWRKQEEEARAWNENLAAATPWLDKLIEVRGLTDKAALVAKIIGNADALVLISAELTGVKQKKENAIEAATTVQEVRDAVQ